MTHHIFKTLPIPGCQCRHAATGKIIREVDTDFMVIKDLKARFCDIGVYLKSHTHPGKNATLMRLFPAGVFSPTHRTVKWLVRHPGHVTILEHGLQKRCTNSMLNILFLFKQKLLYRCTQLHQRAEETWIGQQQPECGFLGRRQPEILGYDGPGSSKKISLVFTPEGQLA